MAIFHGVELIPDPLEYFTAGVFNLVSNFVGLAFTLNYKLHPTSFEETAWDQFKSIKMIWNKVVVNPVEFYRRLTNPEMTTDQAEREMRNGFSSTAPSVTANADRVRIYGNIQWFQEFLVQATINSLASQSVQTNRDEANAFLELSVEQSIDLGTLGGYLYSYIIRYGRLPTAVELLAELGRTQVQGFMRFGYGNYQDETIYKIVGSEYCKLRDERQFFMFGMPVVTSIYGIPSITFAGKTYQGDCADPSGADQKAVAKTQNIDLYCQTSETSSSGTRKSCDVQWCFRVESQYGFILTPEINLIHEGDGSETSCSMGVTQTENGYDTEVCIYAHARSKSGFNAARGWSLEFVLVRGQAFIRRDQIGAVNGKN